MANPISPDDPADPSNNDPGKIELWDDVNAVFLDRTKKITDFSPEYQEIIKNAYRFSAVKYNSKIGFVANRTTDTLDII
jgi:hypothetical protein